MFKAALIHDPEPCKTFADLASREAHNTRKMLTPDATFVNSGGTLSQPIEFIDGDATYEERVKSLLTKRDVILGKEGARVLLHEDIYSVPGWYSNEQCWRDWSKKKWESDPLAKTTIGHIKALHGENLVFLTLHLDEKTAHFHAGSVPLVFRSRQRRGRPSKDRPSQTPETITSWALDHRHLRGQRYGSPGEALGRDKLSAMQDAYHAAIGHFGIARGMKVADLPADEVPDYRLKANRKNEAWEVSFNAKQLQLREQQALAAKVMAQAALNREIASNDLKRAALAIKEAAATEAATQKRKRILAEEQQSLELLRKKTEDDAASTQASRWLAEDAHKRAKVEIARAELARHDMVQATIAADAERGRLGQAEALLQRRLVEMEASAEIRIKAEVEARVSPLRQRYEAGLKDIAELREAFRNQAAKFLRIQKWVERIEAFLFEQPPETVLKAIDSGIMKNIVEIVAEDKPVEPTSSTGPAGTNARMVPPLPFQTIGTERG